MMPRQGDGLDFFRGCVNCVLLTAALALLTWAVCKWTLFALEVVMR